MTSSDKLKIQIPSQGWKQFLTSRTEMLDAFDRAREKSRAHEVETYHGKVAEAQFRNWLSGFLPKRYAVTAGYIVSSGLKDSDKTPHYDVVIYDHLEAPVLRIEDDPDVSAKGRSLAIPVEHVKVVLEVKSKFSTKTTKDAIEHLQDLQPLMGGIDDGDERYKLYLSEQFCCGVVFFDLEKDSEFSETALSTLIDGISLRGFFGGIILRGEGHKMPVTGQISILRSETEIESTIVRGKASLLNGVAMTKSIKVTDKLYFGAMLMWVEFAFARFGFDLIAMMQGTYEVGRVSSFYGMGSSRFEDWKPNK